MESIPDDLIELQRRLDALPLELVEVTCPRCQRKHITETLKGERYARCPACRDLYFAEMNNEGDLPSNDGLASDTSTPACGNGGQA